MARILLAEDEDSVRELVARVLTQAGHEVTMACDGGEAAERLDECRAAGGSFDLLLTDIMMPAMDGIALALRAARDAPGMKILLMTGYADQKERAHQLEAIIHDVLLKPFTLHDLRAMVAEALAA